MCSVQSAVCHLEAPHLLHLAVHYLRLGPAAGQRGLGVQDDAGAGLLAAADHGDGAAARPGPPHRHGGAGVQREHEGRGGGGAQPLHAQVAPDDVDPEDEVERQLAAVHPLPGYL